MGFTCKRIYVALLNYHHVYTVTVIHMPCSNHLKSRYCSVPPLYLLPTKRISSKSTWTWRKGSSSNCPFADAFVVSLPQGINSHSTPSGGCMYVVICSQKVRSMVFGYLLAALPNSRKTNLPCDLPDKFSGWLFLNFPRSQILSQQQKKMVSFLLRRDILGFKPWGLAGIRCAGWVGWIFLVKPKMISRWHEWVMWMVSSICDTCGISRPEG